MMAARTTFRPARATPTMEEAIRQVQHHAARLEGHGFRGDHSERAYAAFLNHPSNRIRSAGPVWDAYGVVRHHDNREAVAQYMTRGKTMRQGMQLRADELHEDAYRASRTRQPRTLMDKIMGRSGRTGPAVARPAWITPSGSSKRKRDSHGRFA